MNPGLRFRGLCEVLYPFFLLDMHVLDSGDTSGLWDSAGGYKSSYLHLHLVAYQTDLVFLYVPIETISLGSDGTVRPRYSTSCVY